MSILVEPNTKVLIQGITGGFGGTHAKLSLDYGTKVVAGVTPGKGGQTFESSVPIFDTVDEAVTETGATVSAIFVPPPFAGDAIMEAVDAGIELIVAITEGIPVADMMRVKSMMNGSNCRLIGPNCPGIVTPGTGPDSTGVAESEYLPAIFIRRALSAWYQDQELLPMRQFGKPLNLVSVKVRVLGLEVTLLMELVT